VSGAEIGTEVYSGMVIKRFKDAKKYLAFHRDYVRTLPDFTEYSHPLAKSIG
jgi:hypothetical protein